MSHVNYDPEKLQHNVILEHDDKADEYKTFKAYVKAYKEQEHITGRFNIDTVSDRNATKVLSCFVMSGSHELIASMTRSEQIEYFRAGLEFLKEEYPTFHIVDSRIHFDEKGLPHAHTSMLPIHIKEDGSKSFNVSQHQKGKDYFKGFQDRFYDYMKERYPDKALERTDPEKEYRKKLSVREYKENQDFKKEIEQERQRLVLKNEKLKDIEKQLDIAYEKAVQSHQHNLRIEEYCKEQGITFMQYEKQCFYADRGYGEYPEPEKEKLERQQERSIEPEIER